MLVICLLKVANAFRAVAMVISYVNTSIYRGCLSIEASGERGGARVEGVNVKIRATSETKELFMLKFVKK